MSTINFTWNWPFVFGAILRGNGSLEPLVQVVLLVTSAGRRARLQTLLHPSFRMKVLRPGQELTDRDLREFLAATASDRSVRR